MFQKHINYILDKILEHLTSPARAVPDFLPNGITNNNASSRNSPCNVYGRSPNEYHQRRLSTGTRKNSYGDRSGSPCLSGYGVIKIFFIYVVSQMKINNNYKFLSILRLCDVDH